MCGLWSFCGSTCYNGKYLSLLVQQAAAWLNLCSLDWVALGSLSIRWLMKLLSLLELRFFLLSEERLVGWASASYRWARGLPAKLISKGGIVKQSLLFSIIPRILCCFPVLPNSSCWTFTLFYSLSISAPYTLQEEKGMGGFCVYH